MNEKIILVVDDEELIRTVLDQALTRAGYSVVSAESGEKTLEVLKNEKIDVIFLDLHLPGMNGLELYRQIRNDNPLIIIYALTGYASKYELEVCRAAGFDDYFTKPANLELLLNAAREGFEKVNRWKHL